MLKKAEYKYTVGGALAGALAGAAITKFVEDEDKKADLKDYLIGSGVGLGLGALAGRAADTYEPRTEQEQETAAEINEIKKRLASPPKDYDKPSADPNNSLGWLDWSKKTLPLAGTGAVALTGEFTPGGVLYYLKNTDRKPRFNMTRKEWTAAHKTGILPERIQKIPEALKGDLYQTIQNNIKAKPVLVSKPSLIATRGAFLLALAASLLSAKQREAAASAEMKTPRERDLLRLHGLTQGAK